MEERAGERRGFLRCLLGRNCPLSGTLPLLRRRRGRRMRRYFQDTHRPINCPAHHLHDGHYRLLLARPRYTTTNIHARKPMKQLLLIAAALLAASTAPAQDWAKAKLEKSPRHGEWVKVKQGDREVNSFITYPEVKDKATAVVVIHEIFGLTDWVRDVTDQLAEAGYIAIDRKSTRLNSSHANISYAVFC